MPNAPHIVSIKPRGKPRGLRRDRDCITCKSRNVKCDLNRPGCLPCRLAGLSCGGYARRVVWVSDNKPGTGHVPGPSIKEETDRPENATRIQLHEQITTPCSAQEQPLSSGLKEKSFLQHLFSFCDRINSEAQQTRDSGQNRISSETIDLVTTVCDFVQTLSSANDFLNNDCPESVEAAAHQLTLLVCLNKALQTANPFAILGIAAFAVFEVCNGPFGQWQHHIRGAKSLLDHHCRSRDDLNKLSKSIPGLIDVVARLAWFDLCGTLTKTDGSTLILDDWHHNVFDDDFFRMVGCPADCYRVLHDITKGAALSNPLGISIQVINQLSKVGLDNSDYSHCADTHRCAAAIAAITRLKDGDAEPFKGQTLVSAVDRLCLVLDSSSESNPYTVFMSLPAYLAGMEAATPQHCNTLRRYWKNCTLAGVHRYPGALEGCEAVWREKGLV
ncbi:unnamed protein product [Clonostachys solani]|uniref:Zn(2)-C6 fungal-type domain-containing protein n=1 Tax=Clonostachys solani TaxID=160281 RepID=A0A9N9ZB87_9HYPO|nr:unnamed protein product [Clonostachys solani]